MDAWEEDILWQGMGKTIALPFNPDRRHLEQFSAYTPLPHNNNGSMKNGMIQLSQWNSLWYLQAEYLLEVFLFGIRITCRKKKQAQMLNFNVDWGSWHYKHLWLIVTRRLQSFCFWMFTFFLFGPYSHRNVVNQVKIFGFLANVTSCLLDQFFSLHWNEWFFSMKTSTTLNIYYLIRIDVEDIDIPFSI